LKTPGPEASKGVVCFGTLDFGIQKCLRSRTSGVNPGLDINTLREKLSALVIDKEIARITIVIGINLHRHKLLKLSMFTHQIESQSTWGVTAFVKRHGVG
jgi:hypothetical protein